MASTGLWERKKKAKIGFAADMMTGPRKIALLGEKNPIGNLALVSNSSQKRDLWKLRRIDSCGRSAEVQSLGALQDRWSLGELHSAQIPRKSATRLGLGEGGGTRTITAVKTSPHTTTSPNPAGKCQRRDRAFHRHYTRPVIRRRRRWVRSLSFAFCIGLGSPCVPLSLSFCFPKR